MIALAICIVLYPLLIEILERNNLKNNKVVSSSTSKPMHEGDMEQNTAPRRDDAVIAEEARTKEILEKKSPGELISVYNLCKEYIVDKVTT